MTDKKAAETKDQNVVHVRITAPKEGSWNYAELKEIFDFLTEKGDLPFDPPVNARPKAGEKAVRDRAIYLMFEGMLQLKKQYPKSSNHGDSRLLQGASREVNTSQKAQEEAPF